MALPSPFGNGCIFLYGSSFAHVYMSVCLAGWLSERVMFGDSGWMERLYLYPSLNGWDLGAGNGMSGWVSGECLSLFFVAVREGR